jgi:hypothetical protein
LPLRTLRAAALAPPISTLGDRSGPPTRMAYAKLPIAAVPAAFVPIMLP